MERCGPHAVILRADGVAREASRRARRRSRVAQIAADRPASWSAGVIYPIALCKRCVLYWRSNVVTCRRASSIDVEASGRIVVVFRVWFLGSIMLFDRG